MTGETGTKEYDREAKPKDDEHKRLLRAAAKRSIFFSAEGKTREEGRLDGSGKKSGIFTVVLRRRQRRCFCRFLGK